MQDNSFNILRCDILCDTHGVIRVIPCKSWNIVSNVIECNANIVRHLELLEHQRLCCRATRPGFTLPSFCQPKTSSVCTFSSSMSTLQTSSSHRMEGLSFKARNFRHLFISCRLRCKKLQFYICMLYDILCFFVSKNSKKYVAKVALQGQKPQSYPLTRWTSQKMPRGHGMSWGLSISCSLHTIFHHVPIK